MCHEQLSSKYVYNIEIGLFIGLETSRFASQVFKKEPKDPERKTPWSVFMLSSHLLFDCRVFYWPLNAERLNKK